MGAFSLFYVRLCAAVDPPVVIETPAADSDCVDVPPAPGPDGTWTCEEQASAHFPFHITHKPDKFLSMLTLALTPNPL